MPGDGAASTKPAAVVDIGGTHVTAAAVDRRRWCVLAGSRTRRALRSQGSLEEILHDIVACTATLGDLRGAVLGVAIPGPFDYSTGIGWFEGVAKLDALRGVNLGRELLERLPAPPQRVVFVNDAEAFALGECLVGAGRGLDRVVGLTLGTGVGSAFVRSGAVAGGSDVPPEGRVDLLRIDGRPLEDTISRRALIAGYRAAEPRGRRAPDVADIAARARDGEPAALSVFTQAFHALGRAVGPWLARFDAQALVLGGAIARSFDVLSPPLRAGLAQVEPRMCAGLRIAPSGSQDSVEVGTAWRAGLLVSAPANGSA